jgi:hypothetical protein
MYIMISKEEDIIKYILLHSFLDAGIFLLCPALAQTLFNHYLAIKLTNPQNSGHKYCAG